MAKFFGPLFYQRQKCLLSSLGGKKTLKVSARFVSHRFQLSMVDTIILSNLVNIVSESEVESGSSVTETVNPISILSNRGTL